MFAARLVLGNEQSDIPGIGSQFVIAQSKCEVSFGFNPPMGRFPRGVIGPPARS